MQILISNPIFAFIGISSLFTLRLQFLTNISASKNLSHHFWSYIHLVIWTLIFYFDFIFSLSILFYFLDYEEIYDCGHMACHMTLYHKLKI